ncbi:MAG: fibronectin type III domain-containing protein, partial [Bacteroidales bacterium]|nr:fibronectin type III domain-containing protein [Bacteroidales bacterium]
MKKLLLFFATMLFLAFGLYAVDVQIGEGSATSYDLPINSCYGYSYSQQIYLESELNDNGGGPGPITKIRFYLNTSANPITAWDNWTVYLGSTTKDVFLSTSDWVPVSELTEVFSGTIPNPVAGTWLELTLPTPFNYTGGNLVVAVDENSSGYACSASWGVFDCGDNRGMIYYDDDTNPNPANPPQANKGPIATISRIQFDMAAYVPTTPPNCAVLLGPNDNSTVLLDQVLIWKSGGGAPTSYDVYFGDSNPPPYIQNQIETNYMPSTIAGKTYYWKIVPRNAVGAADGCDIWSFLTPTATQLFESFEATTFPPLGWTNPGNFSRNTGITYHGVASAYKYSTPNESLLTTPMLTITSTSKLEFYARTNAANTFQRIQVKYSTDRLTWEDIGDPVQLGANSPFEYFSVDISSLAGAKSDYYLAFAVYHVGTAGAVFIDKVFGPEVTPVLPGEVTLTVPADGAINVEARAEFSWTPDVTGGIPMGYKVYIDTSYPPAFEWANVTASPFKAEPPLNYSTTYYWRIGAYNAAGETLSSIRSFTTMDDPTITLFQWIEDFGNLASDPFPPLNWKKHSGKLADPTVLYPHPSGTWLQGKWLNNASFENNAAKVRVFSSYINAWLITPPIAIPQDDFELVFDLALMKTNSNNPPQQTGTDDFFAVLVGDGLSWTPANIVRKWDNQGSEYVYNEIPNEGTIIHIPLGEAGTKYLAFYAESTVINADNEIMIDNVKVRQISTCPDPTNLAVSEITSASVILSWTSGGEEELWNVKYGLNGFNPETEGTLVEGVTNPFALTGLSHSTFYDAYVQADCGSNEVSPWSTKVSFRTDCGTHDLPFAEDFNTLSNGDIPYCWTKTHSNWGAVSSTKAGGVANEMRFHYGPSATSVFRLITPPLNGASVSDYLLTFKHYISYYTTPTLFKVQGSTDGENWIDLWSLASPTGSVGPETITIPLTTISGEVFYIAWTFEGNSYNINGWYIDDVTIDLPQECSAPTMLAITNITNSTAKLGWTANSNENKWNIKYGDPGFDPETEGMLIEGVTDNPFIITGLNENSQYDVYVQADCGDGLLSEWSSKVTFQTLCDIYDLPYIQNFDDVTAPAIPMCMTVTDDNGDEKKWVTSTTNPRSSPNCMYMTYNSSISMDDWFFTPGFNLTGGKAYQVDFYYRSSGTNYPEKLKVKWGVEPNAAGMTGGVIWQNDNVINSVYEKATAIFTPNEDGVYYVGWHGYSDPDKFYLCVDDISIYEAPECPPPAMLTATDITTNSALLGWTPGGDETVWNIEYGPAGFELGQGTLINDIADNPYLLSGLTQATAY